MELNEKHEYRCSPEQLLAYFSEPDRVKEKYQAMGATKVRLQGIKHEDDGWHIATARELDSGIPGILKSMVGDTIILDQSENWVRDGDDHKCDFTIVLQGVPIDIKGKMVVKPTDEGCVNLVTLKLKANLPFIGRKIEQAIGSDSKKMMTQEYKYLLSVLEPQEA